VNEYIDAVINFVQSAPVGVRELLAGFFILLETSIFIGLIIPGDTVVLVASTGVQDWPDFWFLLFAVLVGSLMGETIGYTIGRFFGPKLRDSKLGRRIGEHNWELAEKLIERRGGLAVFISRFIPVLHSLVPAVAGAAGMRYRQFITFTFFACAIWASLYVGVGFAARSSYETLSGNLRWAALIGVGIILAFLGVIALVKKLLHRYSKRVTSEEHN